MWPSNFIVKISEAGVIRSQHLLSYTAHVPGSKVNLGTEEMRAAAIVMHLARERCVVTSQFHNGIAIMTS
jgi:hypothetical protein